MKLTQTNVAKLTLAKGATDKIFFDDEISGFGLRVREGGSRKWVLHYRIGGFQRRYTVGAAGVLTLDEARKKARKVLVAVDDGKDPAAQKATQRADSSLMFSSVIKDYLDVRLMGNKPMKPRSHAESKRHLEKDWKPLHRLVVSSIVRATVATRLREIAKASGPVAADRARSTLSAMFAWAIGEGLCEVNPVSGTNKSSEDVPRERVLSAAEMVAVWNAAPDNDYGRIVKLLLLTGQRRDEIGSLRWSEIDMEEKLIKLPTERTKNKRSHEVPLSDSAIAVLEAVGRRDDRDLVFGIGEGGYSGWSRSKEVLDEAAELEEAWTLHDLRRTVRTGLGQLGVLPHVSEAILNHLPPKLVRTYDRNKYEAEKRGALNRWSAHVRLLVEGGERKVVAFSAAAL
jgi:integrase